jgi:hypothetical protein
MVHPIVDAPQRAATVDDAGIEVALRLGFSPYRCAVEFQENGTKVALHVYGRGKDFAIGAKTVASLRDPEALAQYIRDLRYHLRHRNVLFDVLQP